MVELYHASVRRWVSGKRVRVRVAGHGELPFVKRRVHG